MDISENAEYYLSASLDEHRSMVKSLGTKIKEIIQKNGGIPENNELFQRLIMWKEYLQSDYDSEENEIRYKVREAWMMMNILNLAKTIDGKKLKCLFLCDLRHFNGLEKLALDLGIDTEQIKIKRSIRTEEIDEILADEIEISK